MFIVAPEKSIPAIGFSVFKTFAWAVLSIPGAATLHRFPPRKLRKHPLFVPHQPHLLLQ